MGPQHGLRFMIVSLKLFNITLGITAIRQVLPVNDPCRLRPESELMSVVVQWLSKSSRARDAGRAGLAPEHSLVIVLSNLEQVEIKELRGPLGP